MAKNKNLVKTSMVSDIQEAGADLIKLTKKLLDASVKSSQVLAERKYNEDSMPKARLTLGYLNAFLKAGQLKLQFYRVLDIEGKVEVVKNNVKQYAENQGAKHRR